jgi:hypothetical protein
MLMRAQDGYFGEYRGEYSIFDTPESNVYMKNGRDCVNLYAHDIGM